MTNRGLKTVESLSIDDLRATPVWRYTNLDSIGESCVEPVRRLPVRNLDGKIVGVELTTAGGRQVWGILSNIDAENASLTEHFLTLSVERNGRWFDLSRYHDIGFADATNGPRALAAFLGLDLADVFPISYDIRPYAHGEAAALCGQIRAEPRERLSREQLISLAVP